MAGTVGTAEKSKISPNSDFTDFAGGAFGVSDLPTINPSSPNPTLMSHSSRRSLHVIETESRSGIAAVSDTRARTRQ
jgi:hypothetical protein